MTPAASHVEHLWQGSAPVLEYVFPATQLAADTPALLPDINTRPIMVERNHRRRGTLRLTSRAPRESELPPKIRNTDAKAAPNTTHHTNEKRSTCRYGVSHPSAPLVVPPAASTAGCDFHFASISPHSALESSDNVFITYAGLAASVVACAVLVQLLRSPKRTCGGDGGRGGIRAMWRGNKSARCGSE